MLLTTRCPRPIPAAENHVFMRRFAEEQGIRNYDLREGVCHQVVMEKGRAAPGEIVVGTDSHTCTYGAAGAFATGIGSTDMGFVLKFGALYFRVPESILLEIDGAFGRRVGAKDLILSLAGDIGADGAAYMALEFTGRAIRDMDMAGRMTCANMAIEMGAKAGIVPPDATTWGYVTERRAIEPFDLASDPDASYRERRHYDVTDLAPQVAVPHNVDKVVDVTEVADEDRHRLHRFLHQRPLRGHGGGGGGARVGRPLRGERPGDSHPRLPNGVSEGSPGRTHRTVC